MKVTGPLDVYIIEKLFQLALTNAPAHRSATVLSEKLKNATVVVFGGSYGIGREVADLAKQLGAQTYSFGRSTSGTHIESRADVAAALSSVHAQTGRIDYVVNAAGVLHVGRLDEADDDEIFNTLGVNFLGPILIAQESLPYLSRTGGQLLLFSSSSYTRGRANYSLYSSLKAAVVNLVQALGDEWSSAGVRVNCIVPDRTATPMRMNAFGAEPAESLLAASEVARTTLEVLASDLTGKAVEVKRNDPLLPHVTSLPTGVVPAS